MLLKSWRLAQDLDRSQLAEILGVSHPNTIYRYELPPDHPRVQRPDVERMRRIYVATAGAVSPNDFYDLDSWRAAIAAPVEAVA